MIGPREGRVDAGEAQRAVPLHGPAGVPVLRGVAGVRVGAAPHPSSAPGTLCSFNMCVVEKQNKEKRNGKVKNEKNIEKQQFQIRTNKKKNVTTWILERNNTLVLLLYRNQTLFLFTLCSPIY